MGNRNMFVAPDVHSTRHMIKPELREKARLGAADAVFLRQLACGGLFRWRRYLKTLFGILTWTPYTGRSTSCVMATLPATLTSW